MNREELLSLRDQVIAMDFDGTLVETYCELNEDWSEYTILKILRPIYSMIDLCLELQKNNKMILWTVRSGKYLEEAVEYTKQFGLRWDAVNDNLYPVNKNDRKVWANVYIDDKAVNALTLV